MSLNANNPRKLSLATSLTISYSLTVIALLALLITGLYLSIGAYLHAEMDEDLLEDIEEYQQFYKTEGLQSLIKHFANETGFGDAPTEFIRLLNQSGAQLYASDLSEWQGLSVNPEAFNRNLNSQKPVLIEFQHIAKQEYESRVAYAVLADNLILQIGESTENKTEIMQLLLQSFLLVFALSLPLTSALMYWLARRNAREISLISLAAIDIGNGDFSRRVSTNTQIAETFQLARSFNHMADKVQTLLKEMREITDNIAHDLRSPLGRIRAIAEMSLTGKDNLDEYRQATENTIQECDRLLGLINMTLDVAEAEAGIIRTEYTHFNLTELVADVCDFFEPAAEQKHIQIETDLTTNIHLNGSLGAIQRVVGNLLDNAIKYTPEHGQVCVRLQHSQLGVSIEVSDTGIGIPSKDQQRVFERFFRGDQSRSLAGSGLGLSYSIAVARAHGGDIQLKSEPHRSTAFTISLPVA